jgi:hypothetical protein
MTWNLEGLRIAATYLEEFPILGVVELSRVTYGGRVNHTVVLDHPIAVYGALRDRVIIEHTLVEQVMQ